MAKVCFVYEDMEVGRHISVLTVIIQYCMLTYMVNNLLETIQPGLGIGSCGGIKPSLYKRGG